PAELNTINFTRYTNGAVQPGLVPVGLDEESVKPVYANFNKTKHCIILGQAQKGKTNVLKLMINHMLVQDAESVGIFDSFDRGLSSYASEEK
ncbi:hypothetical protein OSK38_27715, partial [Escherichia coli]|nr:hypothetical protein [Escherichia coli]